MMGGEKVPSPRANIRFSSSVSTISGLMGVALCRFYNVYLAAVIPDILVGKSPIPTFSSQGSKPPL